MLPPVTTTILLRLNASPRADFSYDDLAPASEDEVAALLTTNILEPTGCITTIRCEQCTEGHFSDIEYLDSPLDQDTCAYYDCPTAGRTYLSTKHLQKWTVTLPALCSAVAGMLGTTGRFHEIDAGFYEIGRTQIGDSMRTIYVGGGIGAKHRNGYRSSIELQEMTAGAVVFVLSRRSNTRLFPLAAAVISLNDVLLFVNGLISVDRAIIEREIKAQRKRAMSRGLLDTPHVPLNRLVDLEYSDDFTYLQLKGRKFLLTAPQAEVVQRLARAHINGTPCCRTADLLKNVSESYEPRIPNVFRSLDDWKVLIVHCERRGTYRLNL